MFDKEIMWILFVLIFCLSLANAQKECYVSPCTRDIIIVVDGSSSMKTSTYVTHEIDTILKLIDGWTFSEKQVRLAVVGAYFGNEFYGVDYFTETSLVDKRLQQFRVASVEYGLFKGDFNTTVRYLDERYVGNRALYSPRSNTQKRIIIFTSHSDSTDISSTKQTLETFANLNYYVTIVGIGVSESIYKSTKYHKFVSISFSELSSVSTATINSIIDDGICFYDHTVPTPAPQTCTTSTSTKPTTTTKSATTKKSGPTTTTAPVKPTHPPFPIGDYNNCSCTISDLYIDIIFVVDTSMAMGSSGLMMVKAEINTLIGQVTLDPTQKKHVQVGLIKYSDVAEIVFNPKDYTDEDEFTNDLWTDPRLEKVDTAAEVNLLDGLKEAAKMIEKMRDGVRKVVVVYASAYNDEGDDDPVEVAASIRESGYFISTVAFVEPGVTDLVLKMGEIASPRMNFTSYKDDLLVDELEDMFCQVNCYCPNGWKQLKLENRFYAECYFPTQIDAAWKVNKVECQQLSSDHSGNGHLVYVNSEHKNQFLNEWFIKKWDDESKETMNYDIGYYYDQTTKKYKWVNGVDDNPYTNWDVNNPNLSNGECVNAKKIGDANSKIFKWESVNCLTHHSRAVCQETACDTDFYCDPSTLEN
ncbi:unnamed protein product [Caenorhabditis angaria]|uniref:C-type lectin domain-containing protein n=1 Tax=Caenorhabditis angaria TaxID=860376 RepID=A0A9P1IHH7_9PELO|nr:unnamed protein product [Caenorhabditis angaria]